MNEKKPEQEFFHSFFKEEATELFTSPQPEWQEPSKEAPEPGLPLLPASQSSDEKERKAFWRALRLFLRSGKGGGILDAQGRPLAFPAALAPFRDQPFLEGNYPCWVGEGLEAGLVPVGDLLRQSVLQFAPGPDQALILKANLLRLEQIVREFCQAEKQAVPSFQVWEESLKTLAEQLNISGNESGVFTADVANLQKLLPKSGWVMHFTDQAPLFMLSALVHDHAARYRRRIEGDVAHLTARLRELLAVEHEKSPEAHSAEHLQESLDFANSFLNFDELSHLIPKSGSSEMPKERLQRLENALGVLQQADAFLFPHTAVFVMEKELDARLAFDWGTFLPNASVKPMASGKVAHTALEVFDAGAAKAASFFAAMRIAQLEIDNQYKPEVHDDLFAHFDWRQFSEEEMATCPPVLCCTTAEALLDREWAGFSGILTSNRPVKALVMKRPGEAEPAGAAFRQEPGALAIAHRDVFVFQSAAVHPGSLYQGLKDGMQGAYPALFYMLSPTNGQSMLASSAAVEGREFPGFTFDCRKGPRWGSRFDIHDNPDPGADWPMVSFEYRTAGGGEEKMEIPFSFADFAALNPAFSRYFQVVPAAHWTDDLVPVTAYLELEDEARLTKAPFIWMVNASNELVKAVVAWPLVQICRERLDFWHFLQENAGVHSYHVEQATDRLRQELDTANQKEKEALHAQHEAAITAARETAAREAMERLAGVLLDMDISSLSADVVRPAAPVPAPKPAVAPAAPEAPKAEAAKEEKKEEIEEILTMGEAWVESALCTSCNECINVNKQIFQYNASKQAYVANPRAGTFAEIVKAAENCPVGIIHPGAPQNPDESGLDVWVKRAEKFN